jgi:hypothetical protein
LKKLVLENQLEIIEEELTHIPGNKKQCNQYNTLMALHKRLKNEISELEESTALGFDFNNNDLNFSEFVTQHFIELTND